MSDRRPMPDKSTNFAPIDPTRIDPVRIDADMMATVQRLNDVKGEFSAFTLKVKGRQVTLPPSVGALAIEALANAIQANEEDEQKSEAREEEFTTTQAADLLNVSRPHLVKLLKEGEIPYHKVGSHHRVRRSDVLTYKKAQRAQAEDALQSLTDQAQELDMGY